MSVRVYIYSPNWVMVNALSALSQKPGHEVTVFHTVTSLLMAVRLCPPNGVLLALRPHEHVFLLQQLRQCAARSQLIVVSACFYYADRMIAHFMGQIRLVERSEVMAGYPACTPMDWVMHPSLCLPLSTRRLKHMSSAVLLRQLNQYLSVGLSRCGLSVLRYPLFVRGFAMGTPPVVMARQLNLCEKTVYSYRARVMRCLHLPRSAHSRTVALMRSLQVSLAWQHELGDALFMPRASGYSAQRVPQKPTLLSRGATPSRDELKEAV